MQVRAVGLFEVNSDSLFPGFSNGVTITVDQIWFSLYAPIYFVDSNIRNNVRILITPLLRKVLLWLLSTF